MADFASLRESFGQVIQAGCLCALPIVFWAFVAVWLHEHGIDLLRRFLGMLKTLRGVLAALALAALVAWAGAKPDLRPPSPQGMNPGMRQTGDGLVSSMPDAGGGGTTGTNETTAVGAFVVESVTTNAVACEKWLRRGAARDWFSIANDLTWAFPFGTSAVRRITVSSAGAAILHDDFKAAANANERMLRVALDPRRAVPADVALIAPLRTALGIVPALNWNRLDGAESCFWSASTPSNTLLLTWRNVLLGRSPGKPISFQVELTPGGRFRFAYNLSSATAEPCAVPQVAAFFGILRPINVRPVETTTLRRRRWQDVQSLRARLRFVFAWLS